MEEIIWKQPGDFVGYEVSNTGLLRSFRMGNEWRPIRTHTDPKRGYVMATIYLLGRPTRALLHRLVAGAFIPNHDNKPMVNHIDSNPSNNRVENLEWVTAVENMQHAKKMGRISTGEKHYASKLQDFEVLEIKAHLAERKLMMPEIARRYDVSVGTISNIYRGSRSRNSSKATTGGLGYCSVNGRKKIFAPHEYPDSVIYDVINRLARGEAKLKIAHEVGIDESLVRRIRDGRRKPKNPVEPTIESNRVA